MKKAALLVVDMVNDLFEYKAEMATFKESLTRSINALIAAFRQNGMPIVWVRQEFDAGLGDAPAYQREHGIQNCIRGTVGCQLLAELDYQAGDTTVVKKRYSAFFQTDLDDWLRTQDIRTVVVVGINTHVCIRYTAVDAYQLDYSVIVPTDCVNGYDPVQHKETLEHLHWAVASVMTLRETCTLLFGGNDGCRF